MFHLHFTIYSKYTLYGDILSYSILCLALLYFFPHSTAKQCHRGDRGPLSYRRHGRSISHRATVVCIFHPNFSYSLHQNIPPEYTVISTTRLSNLTFLSVHDDTRTCESECTDTDIDLR